ncbi:MOSC domain-containing protein [Rhizobium sp.]|uniref:MOSC domain-containing protein n=1 Tax=Rhizobium sp. TaxID=391 RepID=UPI00289BDEC2
MEQVCWIEEIWRYPVNSLGGERIASADLIETGVIGDRRWAIVDRQTGEPAAPERDARWRPALFLSARLQYDLPEIQFHDGSWVPVDAPDIDQRLTRHFGFDVSIRPYEPFSSDPSDTKVVARHRYDVSPLHLVTSSSMEWLANLLGEDIDCRRFRPNIVLNTAGLQGLEEKAWLGYRLLMSEATMLATEETKRCGMTLIAQPSLSENPDILRSILRQNRRNFGIYASVDTAAPIAVGDPVLLERAQIEP